MKKIGLIPAAGTANRIAPLPCSKELYPIGFQSIGEGCGVRPKVVSQYLLEKMRLSEIAEVYIVLRKGKWDIPEYFGDGKALNMHLAYLMMDLPFGVPYSLDQAYPFIKDSTVVFGFPDIIFQPDTAFASLLAGQAESNADLVLGLFSARQSQKADMVDLGADGRIREIIIKPARTHLRYAWIIAVWTPVFTQFMHDYLIGLQDQSRRSDIGSNLTGRRELFVGDVIRAAIDNHLDVEGIPVQDGIYLDIGTPDTLHKAIRDSVLQEL
jgi:glucose-1-phosphate thymidylyltransferase